ncbi:cell adhesion molecule DSCAM-like [Antennarius striatus]|uniref:cell adhesion molecule DSCAM-like n=1 Tax=Antennarius striatus TaxID=241820 RepID=UPI0035B15447
MMKVRDRCLLQCFNVFFCLLLGTASTGNILARMGEDVTLTCNYDVNYYGKLSACWGKGAIPNHGCANEVIKSDGTSVTSRLSERYLLLGNLGGGDVSLTIRQVEESDSGTYGCRVEIPGWFNDHKHQLTLTVVPVPPNPLKIEAREVKEKAVTVGWSPVFDGGRPITNFRIDVKNKQASWDTAASTEVSNDVTHVTLMVLRPAKSYNLRMFAANSVGMSGASNVLTVTTKESAPEGPPLDMQMESLTSKSIKVTWKPPHPDLRNGVLRSYSISYREYDPAVRQFRRWQHRSVAATRELESIILSNLKPSTKYGVLVQARTNAGIGPASTAPLCSTLDEVHQTSTVSPSMTTSTAGTMWVEDATSVTSVNETLTVVTAATTWGDKTTSITSAPPDPPVLELKEVRGCTISLSWTPGFEGDSPIMGFYLEYKAVNASWDSTPTIVNFSPDQTDATIIEMNPSTYNIRMFAESSLGTSEASNVLTITTREKGHQTDDVFTTVSTDKQAATSIEESRGGRLVAVVVPVVLVVLIIAILVVWKLRLKQKKGSLNMWLSSGALRPSGSESLQEL